jgi:lipocalin
MIATRFFALATIALATMTSNAGAAANCPPKDFQVKSILNPLEFFNGKWFPLKQLPVIYQPVEDFYCVTAEYKIEKTKLCQFRGCDDIVVRVFNGANKGSVNGQRTTANLNGIIKDPAFPSKASVGPRFLPSLFYGPYWVVEAGSYSDLLEDKTSFDGENYEWAIISVGAPDVATQNGCLPGVGRLNPEGVWLFSRKAIVPAEVTEKLTALAASKGFDVTALKTVVHEGCSYN